MRELKFRRWDSIGKRFVYFTLEDYPNEGDLFDLGRSADGPFEQYTGLKDKNGNEIWEGDILEIEMDYLDYSPVKFKSVVRFENGSFNAYFGNDEESKYKTVKIGNIHESGV